MYPNLTFHSTKGKIAWDFIRIDKDILLAVISPNFSNSCHTKFLSCLYWGWLDFTFIFSPTSPPAIWNSLTFIQLSVLWTICYAISSLTFMLLYAICFSIFEEQISTRIIWWKVFTNFPKFVFKTIVYPHAAIFWKDSYYASDEILRNRISLLNEDVFDSIIIAKPI